MKVWLNNLKENDIFYYPSIILYKVLKYRHLGNANNRNFIMPTIKAQLLENNLEEDIREFFVNQYVYTNYEDAYNKLTENSRIQKSI